MAGLPIAANTTPQQLANGATWSEGPLWLPDMGLVIWSDIPGNRILQWRRSDGASGVYRTDVEFTNGRCHWNGAIAHCSHGRRAIEVERGGEVAILVDRIGHARLNSPNDIAAHPDGSLWFTDPPYGIMQPHEGYPGEPEYGGSHVFRYGDGRLLPVIADVLRPNGIAFSPDGQVVYVTDTSSALGDGPDHAIRAYRFTVADGTVEVIESWRFADVEPGIPDGIAVDIEGRVWSSSASGVQVFDPDGTALGVIELPEVVGNLCFGGPGNDELYIAASTSLYRICTLTRGAV